MKALVEALEQSMPQINWFAIGEAKNLHEEVRVTLKNLNGNLGDPATKKRLMDIGWKTRRFLMNRGVQAADTIANQLFTILNELESPKKEKG